MTTSTRDISLDAIRDAARFVYRAAVRTPLVQVDVPGAPDGVQLHLKLEVLQPIGSFKIRGAANVMRQLSTSELADGVWTVSAGNAALGVAYAARQAGVPCSVMVMDTAPAAKVDAINRLGASIVRVTYDEAWATVERHASSRMRGYFIHPFDDDRFIAGNATLALEILEDLPDVDAIVGSVGGGGLLSGVVSAVRVLRPAARVYAAEPETAAPLSASLTAGHPMYFPNWRASFVDGAGGKSVLDSMWPLLRQVNGSVVVTLDEVARAIRIVAERAHVIAEGAAGCAVAAALSGRIGTGKVVAIISGGNIDLTRFFEILQLRSS